MGSWLLLLGEQSRSDPGNLGFKPGCARMQAVQQQVSLEQVRVRVDLENSKREAVAERLKEYVGVESFWKIKKGAKKVLEDRALEREFIYGLANVRASPGLPPDVAELLDVSDPLHAAERHESCERHDL